MRPRILIVLLALFIRMPGAPGPAEVSLTRLMRVRDSGGEFYFRYPSAPVVADDGGFFLLDHEQLLAFGDDGTFRGNFLRSGLGPGELNHPESIHLLKDRLVVFNKGPAGVLWFSRTGEFTRRQSIHEAAGWAHLVTAHNGRWWFLKERFPPSTAGKFRILDVEVRLLSQAVEGDDFREEAVHFPKKYAISKAPGSSYIKNVYFPQRLVLPGGRVLIYPGGTYRLWLLDLESLRLRPFAERPYATVAIRPQWRKHFRPFTAPHLDMDGRKFRQWSQSTLDDIQALWRVDDEIWVLTSTFHDANHGVRADRYRQDGTPLPPVRVVFPAVVPLFHLHRTPMTVHNRRLYIFQRDEDDNWELTVYRIGKPQRESPPRIVK